MILDKKITDINPILLTNLTFSFIPISFVFGNFFVNANLILFCCLGIFHLRSNILKIKFDFPLKIIFLFFFIIFFSTCLSFIKSLYYGGYEYADLVRLIKSVAFFRYFLFIIIIYLLSEFEILNFKYFFITAAILPLIISLDIIFQDIFGFNIIGFESIVDRHNSGFFKDEIIAGGFIKKFSAFSILFFLYKLKDKSNLRLPLNVILICILGIGIMSSGNRMPLVFFLFSLLLLFLFNKNLRLVIPISYLCLFILFKFITSFDTAKHDHYLSFLKVKNNESFLSKTLKTTAMVSKKILNINNKTGEKKETTTENVQYKKHYLNSHVKLFLTGIEIWKSNKLFGNGIKSFRKDCVKLQDKEGFLCSTHPHNYYIEILTETGVIGFLIVLVIGTLFLIFIFKNFQFLNKNNKESLFLLAATVSLISETFPIKSTGSIFSTNSTYLILMGSIILSRKSLLAKIKI